MSVGSSLIVYEPVKELCEWANKGIFGWGEWDGQSKAIGQVIDEKLVSVVTYSDFKYSPDRGFYSCEMGIYSIDKRWCNRHYLKTVFHTPSSNSAWKECKQSVIQKTKGS